MIRPVDAGDFAAIAAITNHYIATTAIHFAYEPVTDAALRDSWQAHRETHPWFVAEDGGRVVGYAKAGIWRERPAYAWTTEIGLYLAFAAALGFYPYFLLIWDVLTRSPFQH